MSRRNDRIARAVALASRDLRQVGLRKDDGGTADVERKTLPSNAVATLDNGPARQERRGREQPRRTHNARDHRPKPTDGAGPRLELPAERNRVAAAETELADEAAEIWREIAAATTEEMPTRGKVRKQIGRTVKRRGLYMFVAAGMHASQNAKKAKGRAAARRKTIDEAARCRQGVRKEYPEHLDAFDGALRHALANPAPLPKDARR